jgi:hypothetical protein
MASTVTNLQSGSLEYRREGVSVLTKEQQVNTSIVRMRPNSNDLLVYLGRAVNDNFFDDNLLDRDSSGSITSAPNSFAEKRTLGQGENQETQYTEITDFDAVKYIEDEGLAMYPTILTALGYADPVSEDGTMGVFETRSELTNFRFLPGFAKRGAKASLCSSAESIDHSFSPIKQVIPRVYSSNLEKRSRYVEANDGTEIVSIATYQDQPSPDSRPFKDGYDTDASLKLETGSTRDSEISRVLLLGPLSSTFLSRDEISAPAGWTFLNNVNGTDSIVYSDRS